ncbi:MAG: thioredoxin [Clostridia bacterium]|nr:thioredoxin [Clostridia bacterium]
MASSEFVELNGDNFSSTINSEEKYVLVDFFTPTCRPCKAMLPYVKQIAKAYEDKLAVYKVNAEENTEICTDNNVSGVPTLLLFKDGKEVDRKVGYVGATDLRKWIGANVK